MQIDLTLDTELVKLGGALFVAGEISVAVQSAIDQIPPEQWEAHLYKTNLKVVIDYSAED